MIITDKKLIQKIQELNKNLTQQEVEKIVVFTRFNEDVFFGDNEYILKTFLPKVVNNLTGVRITVMNYNKEKFLILTEKEVNKSQDIKPKCYEELVNNTNYFIYKLEYK